MRQDRGSHKKIMLYFSTIVTFAILLSPCSSQVTRQECEDQGGVVVGDIGDGAIFDPGYVCATNGLPPTDFVVAGEGEPMAIEGEVCCGGTDTFFVQETDVESNVTLPEISRQECNDEGGVVIGDIGDGAIFDPGYVCATNGLPPTGFVVAEEGESVAIEGEVCCGGTDTDFFNETGVDSNVTFPEISRQECQDEGGVVIGDIGDGAIFDPGYVCATNGLPPTGFVVAGEGESIAIEGEVCCGGTDTDFSSNVTLPMISRQECQDEGGVVIGDIGDGAIFDPGYVCATDGLPPTGFVVAGEGESIAIEGEVCCGGNETDVVGGNSTRPEMTVDDCLGLGGVLTYDIGDGAIHREDYVCEVTGLPPLGTVIASSGESMPREGQVCCPSPGNQTSSRDEYTRQECTDMDGVIVGDIGDGAIFQDDYACESSGRPPIANIVQDEEPFAIEGEVCCQRFVADGERDQISRQECDKEGGEIVSDIGDGSTQLADYRCASNGEPPIANVVPLEGEPISDEGEVCCGPAATKEAESDTLLADGALSFSLQCVLGLVVLISFTNFL